MQSHPPEAKRRATAVAALTLATALVAVVPAVAQTAEPVAEEHCVVVAVDTASDGRLVLDEPECYPTVADAAEATEVALVDVAASNRSVSRSALASDSAGQQVAQASSKTLGIHYDGTSGIGQLDHGRGQRLHRRLLERLGDMEEPDLVDIQRLRSAEALRQAVHGRDDVHDLGSRHHRQPELVREHDRVRVLPRVVTSRSAPLASR